MRKVLLICLALLPIAISAQGHNCWLAVYVGQQFRYANLEASPTYALEFGYTLSKHWAITGQLSTYEGEVKHNLHYGPNTWSGTVTSRFYVLAVAPECSFDLGAHFQLYGQIMIGHTLGSTKGVWRTVWYTDAYAHYYPDENVLKARQNKWTVGLSMGLRFLPTPRVGFDVRLCDTYYDNGFLYPYEGFWNDSHLKEIRFGMVVRF